MPTLRRHKCVPFKWKLEISCVTQLWSTVPEYGHIQAVHTKLLLISINLVGPLRDFETNCTVSVLPHGDFTIISEARWLSKKGDKPSIARAHFTTQEDDLLQNIAVEG